MIDTEKHIEKISLESLDIFSRISLEAKTALQKRQTEDLNPLAQTNTFTDTKTVDSLNSNKSVMLEGYRSLINEPALARVVALDENGEKRVIFISRKFTISLDNLELASYQHKTGIGRLAAVDVGDEVTINIRGNSQTYELLEKVIFRPGFLDQKWDSKPSIFKGEEYGSVTIDSLLSWLSRHAQENEDAELALNAILSGSDDDNYTKGLQHEVITSMQLRDQPILDKFQDEIFRLPLATQLLILGPPGTGKTTTLIRRLGQKITLAMLDQETTNIPSSNNLNFEQNWLMFTPTDLLKHFVKEAFNREQIAASNNQIKTWDSYRKELAVQALGVLQSPNTTGRYIHKKDQSILKPDVKSDPIDWFDNFSIYHIKYISKQLTQGLEILNHLRTGVNSQLINKISKIISDISTKSIISVYRNLDEVEKEINPLLKSLKAASDKMIRKSLLGTFNKNRSFLKELAKFIDTLKLESEADGEEEFDDESAIKSSTKETSAKKAEGDYNQTIRSLARYKFLKREAPKNSKAYKIANWLGDRVPLNEDLNSIGENIVTQNGLRRFVNASKRFVSEVPASYNGFRKQSFKTHAWYQHELENYKHIESMELDVIILLMLKNSRLLLSQNFVIRNIEEPRYSLLNIISEQFRNQILVDEATDFSPIQLSCMENLTDLKTKSFFACGDFNQRLTSWGTRNHKQMDWISKKLEIRSINTIYRQSQKLNEFSGKLLEVIGGSLENHGTLPEDMKHTGFAPILIEECSDIHEKVKWLAERIKEVIRAVKQMPTIAILVNSKDEVDHISNALNPLLEDINQNVVACSDQNLGIDNDIRVFEVQHIKGLEFEAVFFVGVDQLALQMEDLFGKYLYVGATRSATYFGMTCDNQLPNIIEPLRYLFEEKW